MEQLIKTLNSRIETLQLAIQQAAKDQGKYPAGHLRCSTRNGHDRYYHVTNKENTDGKYIRKKDRILAQRLAQKEYSEEFLEYAGAELMVLQQTLDRLENNGVDGLYNQLLPSRQKLITPYVLNDEQFSVEWQAKTFPPYNYKEENKLFETRRGELVRSKSEMILADMFLELGIPYRYEQPIRMKEGNTRHPDFTLLKRRTREEFYLEHMGKMGDPEYVQYSLLKLDQYRANGIYLGKNLLITYETEEKPLDIAGVRKMIKALFL